MKKLLIAVFIMCLAVPSYADMIVNGGFETGSNPPAANTFDTLLAGNTQLTGWTIGGSGIDWIHAPYWQAASGSFSIDLSAGNAGSISQVLATTPGTQYEVEFALSGNYAQGVGNIKTVNVSADGTSQDFTFDVTGKTAINMGWVEQEFLFTATGTSTTLTFRSLTDTAYGPALDDISCEPEEGPTPTPEPSTLMLIGFGLAGLAGVRRFKK